MEQYRAAKSITELNKVEEIPFDKESLVLQSISNTITFYVLLYIWHWITKILQYFYNFEDPQVWNEITDKVKSKYPLSEGSHKPLLSIRRLNDLT